MWFAGTALPHIQLLHAFMLLCAAVIFIVSHLPLAILPLQRRTSVGAATVASAFAVRLQRADALYGGCGCEGHAAYVVAGSW